MAQYELNLRDYLRIFHKRRLLIILVFLAVTALSVVYLYSLPALYKADVTIKIEERKTIAGLLTEWIMYAPGDVMESQTKIIKGYPILKRAGEKLGKLPANAAIDKINAVVGQLQGSVETERVAATNIIKIIATASTAKEAMDTANIVAEVYIEENLQEKAKQARHVRQFIEDQLAALENRLKSSEERLGSFGKETQDLKLEGPIQDKLVSLEFQLADLQQKYTDRHPTIIQLKDQIKVMESRLSSLSSQGLEFSRINREIEVNKRLYGMLKEKLEEARITEAQKISDISVVNPAFLPSAPISGNRSLKIMLGAMMGLLLGVTFAFVFETLDTSISTIEDVENVMKLPVLGLIPSIHEELKRKKRVPDALKGSGQDYSAERFMRLISHYEPQSSAAEAYRNVYTNLKHDPKKKTILITSSGAREGKSSVSANLGIIIAQTGLKTLLISADLRRPTLAKAFGIRKEPGLNELLTESAGLDGAIHNITDMVIGDMSLDDIRMTPGLENLSIIPSGKLPYNPAKLLGSNELDVLIEKLKVLFDVIIFDAPPVLPVTDANLLAPKMDSVVIVYEIGRTSREALMRTKIQLESVGAKITGVVLNNTRTNTEGISIYPYYNKYKYKYYSNNLAEEKVAAKT